MCPRGLRFIDRPPSRSRFGSRRRDERVSRRRRRSGHSPGSSEWVVTGVGVVGFARMAILAVSRRAAVDAQRRFPLKGRQLPPARPATSRAPQPTDSQPRRRAAIAAPARRTGSPPRRPARGVDLRPAQRGELSTGRHPAHSETRRSSRRSGSTVAARPRRSAQGPHRRVWRQWPGDARSHASPDSASDVRIGRYTRGASKGNQLPAIA